MKLHILFPFHTIANESWSHCAFTSRAVDIADMLVDQGYDVTAYGNEGSVTRARLASIVSGEEHGQHFQKLPDGVFSDTNATLGSDGWKLFDSRARGELRVRVEVGDAILHPFGRTHKGIIRAFPEQVHVEPCVGYNDAPQGAFRIFESEAWRHYHLGRYETMRNPLDGQPMFMQENGLARNFSWVIQNARDAKKWPVGDGSGDYCLFMGRICDVKGTAQIAEMIRRWDRLHPGDGLRFVFAGQGDFDRVATMTMKGNAALAARLEYAGHVRGSARAELVGNARLMLCPTQYVEPGGGSAIESMLCGTPVLASAWGCFTESVIHGVTGYQCRTMADWLAGIEHAGQLSRRTVAQVARERHSFEVAGPQYAKVFKQLELILSDDETTSLNVPG